MPDTPISDLWPESIDVGSLTPTMLLNAQAQFLRQRTQGILDAEVRRRRSTAEITTVVLDIIARGAGNYRERVLIVRHGKHPYPALLISEALVGGDIHPEYQVLPKELSVGLPKIDNDTYGLAANLGEFRYLVSIILQSRTITTLIENLIAMTNETKLGLSKDDELLDQDEVATAINEPHAPPGLGEQPDGGS